MSLPHFSLTPPLSSFLPFQNIFIHVCPPFLLFAETGMPREDSPPDANPREGVQDPEGTQ